jgi:hypothetical protein
VALVGLTLSVAACGTSSDSGGSHPAAAAKVSITTTTEDAGPNPALAQDAQAVAADLSSLSTDEDAMDQLTQTVTAESQALQQLTTDANDGQAVCYSQLSNQAATLSSNADALDGAAQTVTNDRTQLNSTETAYRILEQSVPSEAPADAPSFSTVLDAITAADGDLGEAGAERGTVNLTLSSANGNEMASRTC